jgi:hypothetical protein
MQTSLLKYPRNESIIQDKLNSIFHEWHSVALHKCFPYERTPDDMVLDGFFPNYLMQKCKVLFIGQESLELTGSNYIDQLHRMYTIDKAINGRPLNQCKIHKLMLKIAYGLNNNCCDWDNIPQATEIAETFATEQGISFAFMNLSKLSNDSGDSDVDWPLIDGFIEAFKDSQINYFAKQIDTIYPDIILTMNLEERLKTFGNLSVIKYGETASYYTLHVNNKEYFLIDLYHFSARNKPDQDCYYEPVLKGINKFQTFNSDA